MTVLSTRCSRLTPDGFVGDRCQVGTRSPCQPRRGDARQKTLGGWLLWVLPDIAAPSEVLGSRGLLPTKQNCVRRWDIFACNFTWKTRPADNIEGFGYSSTLLTAMSFVVNIYCTHLAGYLPTYLGTQARSERRLCPAARVGRFELSP